MRRRGEGCFKWKFQALQLGGIAYTRGAILGARVDGGHQWAAVKVGFHILFLSRKLLVDLRHDLIAIFVTARHCEQHILRLLKCRMLGKATTLDPVLRGKKQNSELKRQRPLDDSFARLPTHAVRRRIEEGERHHSRHSFPGVGVA